jgi:hypothetical protein
LIPSADNLVRDRLLDELALAFARAAVEQFLLEQADQSDGVLTDTGEEAA